MYEKFLHFFESFFLKLLNIISGLIVNCKINFRMINMIDKLQVIITDNEGNTQTKEITDELTLKKLNALSDEGIDVSEAISDAVNDLTVGKKGIIDVEDEIESVKNEIIKLKSVNEEARAALDEKLKDLEEKRDSLLI